MAIEARRLTKLYGPVLALHRVSLDIGAGITALVGPNGAGKSTLFALMTGQIRPSSGEIRMFGVDPAVSPGCFRHIGYAAEYDGFLERDSGLDFVTLQAKLGGFASGEAKVLAGRAIERVGMQDACKRPIRTYSKGMRQRIKLAQAIVHDPQVLLLDEPMTGLDPLARHEVTEIIRDFARHGKTILIASHILHEVESLTDEFIVLARGKVMSTGTKHSVRGSLDHDALRIVVKCDRPRVLAARLIESPEIEGLEIVEGAAAQVTVHSRDPSATFDTIQRVVVAEHLVLHEIKCPEESVGSLLRDLTLD